MDVRFKTPANFYIYRQTQCGKSYFTRYMLRYLEELFYPVPTKIIYCYGEYQKEFDELPPSVELTEGFPDHLNDMVRRHDHSLVCPGRFNRELLRVRLRSTTTSTTTSTRFDGVCRSRSCCRFCSNVPLAVKQTTRNKVSANYILCNRKPFTKLAVFTKNTARINFK